LSFSSSSSFFHAPSFILFLSPSSSFFLPSSSSTSYLRHPPHFLFIFLPHIYMVHGHSFTFILKNKN
jgi:hypothetical protein